MEDLVPLGTNEQVEVLVFDLRRNVTGTGFNNLLLSVDTIGFLNITVVENFHPTDNDLHTDDNTNNEAVVNTSAWTDVPGTSKNCNLVSNEVNYILPTVLKNEDRNRENN